MKFNILFVCTLNKMRSATAEAIYKNDIRFNVKSAGIHIIALNKLNNELIIWADYILVMEVMHINFIKNKFSVNINKLVCLNIDDEFDYMDKELIKRLNYAVEAFFKIISESNINKLDITSDLT